MLKIKSNQNHAIADVVPISDGGNQSSVPMPIPERTFEKVGRIPRIRKLNRAAAA
jgi:hypothetical protein